MSDTNESSIEFLKRYQLWRSGKDTRTMTEAGILPSDITKHLNAVIESADVSAALIAELYAVLLSILPILDQDRDLSDYDTQRCHDGVKMRRVALRLVQAALTKTPESVGADLAKLKARIAKLEGQADGRESIIRGMEKQTYSIHADYTKAVAQRDALILAGNAVSYVLEEINEGYAPHKLSAWHSAVDEAVKQSGNRPETPAKVATHEEKVDRRVREVRAEFGSLAAFFAAVEARKGLEQSHEATQEWIRQRNEDSPVVKEAMQHLSALKLQAYVPHPDEPEKMARAQAQMDAEAKELADLRADREVLATGELSRVGQCTIHEQDFCGLFIALTAEELQSIKNLRIGERVTVSYVRKSGGDCK